MIRRDRDSPKSRDLTNGTTRSQILQLGLKSIMIALMKKITIVTRHMVTHTQALCSTGALTVVIRVIRTAIITNRKRLPFINLADNITLVRNTTTNLTTNKSKPNIIIEDQTPT